MIKTAARLEPAQRLDWLTHVAPYLALALLALPTLLLRLDSYPNVWLDEGFSMHAARTLAERGVYGTATVEGIIPFNPGVITTGPTMILPIALSFKLFGAGVVQARLVVVLFALLALIGVYGVATSIYGRRAGLFALLFMLAMPPVQDVSILSNGRQVLGETPALSCCAIGFWLWFHSWERDRWLHAGLAGVAFGLGLLAKMQLGIVLLPTLALVGIAHAKGRPARLAFFLFPAAVLVAMAAIWAAISQIGVSADLQQENRDLLMAAVKASVITGLLGYPLSHGALLIASLMVAGACSCGWRLWRQAVAGTLSQAQWAESALAVFALLSALWFAIFSAGWPRYAYVGCVFGLLLCGRLAWDALHLLRQRLLASHLPMERSFYLALTGGLALLAITRHMYPLVSYQQDNQAKQTAQYIRAEIPRSAVIESWEWELDALSDHWNYHHPNHRYLYLAIEQFARAPHTFDLRYDALAANPDYLITGPFSNWTQIYDSASLTSHFIELKQIGAYRIYQRIHY